MDIIKFIIEEPTPTHLAVQAVGVALYLNGNKVPHNILNTPKVVAAHSFKFAEFDLYTCSCGEPGCAGFQSPVVQVKNGETVTWTFPETDDYKTDKKVYEFENAQFTAEFEQLLANLLKLEEDGIYDTTLIPLDYGDEQDPLELPQSIAKSFEWYGNRYQAEQNQREMLQAEFPEMMDKQFAFTYDGTQGKYSYDFTYLIGRLLNHFPRVADEPEFLDECKVAGRAIIKAINNEPADFQTIANDTYVKLDDTAFSFIEWDIEGVTEENFELNKLGLAYFVEKEND